jgi:hypothetical protein
LRFYEHRYLDITEEIFQQIILDTNGFEIEKVVSARWNNHENRFELECTWWGFEDSYTTWEPLERVEESNPDLLDRFLLKADPTEDIQLLKKKRGLVK